MLDDLVSNPSPLGGGQRHARCHPELIDHSDERTRPHRWPDGEDPHADHPPLQLGNGDRRGGNEEQVSEVVGVLTSVRMIVSRSIVA